MMATLWSVDGFAPCGLTPSPLSPSCFSASRCARQRQRPALRLQGQDNNEGREEDRVQKWAAPVLDESAERIESVKAGVLSAVVGSIAMAPIGMYVLFESVERDNEAASVKMIIVYDGILIYLDCRTRGQCFLIPSLFSPLGVINMALLKTQRRECHAACLESTAWYPSNAFDPQWELAHDGTFFRARLHADGTLICIACSTHDM